MVLHRNIFSLKCGIRQGCPLSALLFIIAVETLSHTLKSNPAIKGIKINSKVVTITQLADDTTLFLSVIRSLQISLNIIYTFFKASVLRLNYAKTEIMGLRQKNSRYKMSLI